MHPTMKKTENMTPFAGDPREAGFVVPLIGRKVVRDVVGAFPGFPLIKEGETVTREIVERASRMGRLFELTDATGVE